MHYQAKPCIFLGRHDEPFLGRYEASQYAFNGHIGVQPQQPDSPYGYEQQFRPNSVAEDFIDFPAEPPMTWAPADEVFDRFFNCQYGKLCMLYFCLVYLS